MYKARVSWDQLRDYLKLLTDPKIELEMILKGARRCETRIILDILGILFKEPTKKTQIMYKAGLSFAQLEEYLKLLKRLRFYKTETEDGATFYKITSRGEMFLDGYGRLKGFMAGTDGKLIDEESGIFRTTDRGVTFMEYAVPLILSTSGGKGSGGGYMAALYP